MRKICLIGDPHFANRKLFGSPTSITGRNSRLNNIVTVFEWIDQKLHEDYPEVEDVFILGDITHDHGLLTPAVFEAVQYSISVISGGGRRSVQCLTGNHDQDVNGLSILKVFDNEDREAASIHDPDECYPQGYHGGAIIYPVSYGSDLPRLWRELEARKGQYIDPVILLMHHHFEGAVHGVHEFQPPGGLSARDIPECVSLVCSGHYHKRQWIGNRICYIGAPIQHDFGEADYIPSFTILTIDEGIIPVVQFVEIPEGVAPRFHILPHTIGAQSVPGDSALDYYRLDLPMDMDPANYAWLSDEIGIKNLIVKSIPTTAQLRSRVGEYLGDESKTDRVELGDVIEAYTVLNVEDEERQQELITLGKDIANKVRTEV